MKLPESLISGDQTLQTIVDQFPVSSSDERLKLFCLNDTKAVVGLLIEDAWKLIAEESYYEPSGAEFDEESKEAPFHTSGTVWTIDPSSGVVIQDEISFDEGEIQGLVYAADAIVYGGECSPSQYVDWLIEYYTETNHEAMQGDTVDQILTPNHALAFILEEAGIVNVPTVLERSGIMLSRVE